MVSTTVQVEVFGRERLNFLFSPDKAVQALTGTLLAAEIAKLLKMQAPSLQLFALHYGTLQHPRRVVKPTDVVSKHDSLCFRRRNFDLELERKLLLRDDQALHLLFAEARARVDSSDIELSGEERVDLEALDDPLFPTERQYVDYLMTTCRQRYQTVRFRDCRVGEGGAGDLPPGTEVTALFTEDCIRLVRTQDGKPGDFECPWNRVKSWNSNNDTGLAVFVLCGDEEEDVLKQQQIELQSNQASLMTACAMKVCVYLADTRLPDHPPSSTAASQSKTAIGRFFNPFFEEFSKTVSPSPSFKKI